MQLPSANQSPLAKQSSVNHNYATRASRPDVNFDALQPGAKASEGKVWQHEFVQGGGGGWFEADDPAAQNKASLPNEEAAPAAPSGGGAGADMGSLGSMALGGFQQAQAQDPVAGASALPMPNAANPMLGQRIYPMAMRQLSMAGRFY